MTLSIFEERFLKDFNSLAQIGATEEGGINRPTFSEAHLAARKWFRERADRAGLEIRVDGAGNHSAILRKAGANRTLLLGSHLDSVPNGGRFDGALGVVSALEVLRTIQEQNINVSVNLEAVDFTDEEGSLINFMGSRAMFGFLEPDTLHSPPGGRKALMEGLRRAGLTEEGLLTIDRDPDSVTGYLELHIEQGPKLESASVQIGVVSGIVGISSYRISFFGRAAHSGTTPMEMRADAGLGASSFLLAAREIVIEKFPDCVANVGNMEFKPGVFNVVPERVDVSFEIRSIESERLNALKSALNDLAEHNAERFGLGLEIVTMGNMESASMSPRAQEAIRIATEEFNLQHMTMFSGAGHDAQILAKVVPAGMIFVPSVDGISHNPHELTRRADCINGANVLLGAALRMAEGKG